MSTKPPSRGRTKRSHATRPGPTRNELRIIGGSWRGRRVRFPSLPGLRPTPDRVRETLFNWLQPVIAGSRCLDLFAGSGALGLEALSRGAKQVLFVDRDRSAIEQLRATISELGAVGGELRVADARRFIAGAPETFDVVFLDPPFTENWLTSICAALESGGWLAPDAYIYIEQPARAGTPAVPARWILHRTGRAGEVGYHLARRQAALPASEETR